MPTVKNAITDLSGLKTLVLEKAAKAESSRTDQQIQSSQIKAAEQRIGQAESSVTRYEMEKTKAEDKLSPPPTKTVAGDGKKGGSKTIVDEREKDKLQSQVRAAALQVQQAQSAVEAARAEADQLKNNVLASAGLTEQQGSEMAGLERQIKELETLSKDDQIDLTGEAFQGKLNTAVENTKKLAGSLPNNANAALADFWNDIGEGLGAIDVKIKEQITPKPAEVKKSNNYQGFFEDVEQGFDAILENLESRGEGIEILSSVRNSRDQILGKEGTYLAGMTPADDSKLSGFLTHVNTMIKKMQGGELTDAQLETDLAKLNVLSGETNTILGTGGRAFEDTIKIPFDTAAINLDGINSRLTGNAAFDSLYSRFEGIYTGGNSFDQLVGITKPEVDAAYDFATLAGKISEQLRKGETPSAEDLQALTTKGNALADNLENKYNFSNANSNNGSGRGSGGGNGRGVR
jgi:hypothetical protein